MAQFYFSANLGNGHMLCLAPLSETLAERAGIELQDPAGYFLYEMSRTGEGPRVDILARVDTDEAAIKLSELMKLF